jgi:hemoglobin-like flavoprotein
MSGSATGFRTIGHEGCAAAQERFMSQPAGVLFDVYSRSDNPLLRATLAPVVVDPSGFGRRFYARLFERAPALRRLFPTDMTAQETKLVHTLGVVAAGLDEPERVAQMLAELGARHRGYGVKFAHYLEVGEALLDTLAEVNGRGFDPAARAAWQRLYSWIAQQMRRG